MENKEKLLIEINELTKKRNRLLDQIRYAEQLENVAWDSYYAVADHIKVLERKNKISKLYWNTSQAEIQTQSELVIEKFDTLRAVVKLSDNEKVNLELDIFKQELEDLFNILGIEIGG